MSLFSATSAATFYVYQDARRQWRWRLSAVNGQIIADSGEGYHSKFAARQAITRLKMAVPIARVVAA